MLRDSATTESTILSLITCMGHFTTISITLVTEARNTLGGVDGGGKYLGSSQVCQCGLRRRYTSHRRQKAKASLCLDRWKWSEIAPACQVSPSSARAESRARAFRFLDAVRDV